MGLRGPAPLPANVHQLRGNPSKKPNLALLEEFRPEIEIPDSPPWMWSEAKKEWKRITPELSKYGLIAKVDRAALALYCMAWAKLVWAEKMMSRAMKLAADGEEKAIAAGKEWKGGDGFMIPTPNGSFTYSPYWVAAQRAGAEVNRYLAAFGMSPSSRSRVVPSDNRQSGLFDEPGEDEWKEV